MQRILSRSVAVLVVAGTLGTAAWGADADARGAIEAANKAFMQAFARGDAAALAAMYSDDAIAFPPSGKPTQGRQAIGALWQGLIDSKGTGFTLTTTEVKPAGDLVVETGRYSVTPPGGQAIEGNYLVVWKREGGAWKLHRDIWN
jgi:uncharacterized protein (TIGR02246 family)